MGYWTSITFLQGQQDIVNNRTYMTVYLSVHASNGYYAEHTNASGTLNINGVDYPFSGHYRVNGSSQIIHSVGVWIPHNQDGSKTLYASASFDTRVVGVLTTSNSVTLTTIPRASSPTTSKSTVTFGESFDILTHRKSNNFTHDVYVMANNDPSTYTKIADKIPTDMTWTLPKSWQGYFPTAEVKLLVRVFTFNGSALLGRIDAPLITVRPTPDMLPECEISVEDETENFSKYGGFVQGQSKAKITLNNTFKYNAYLRSQSITVDDITYNTGTQIVDVVNQLLKITGKVIDSRNGETIKNNTLEIMPWHQPVIKSVRIERCRADGTEDGNGDYINVSYDVIISRLNNKNLKSLVIKLSKQEATGETSHSIQLSDYEASGNTIIECSSDYAWNIELKLEDAFSESVYTQLLGTGFTLIDFHSSGRGMAVGKVSEHKSLFDINLPTRFRKSIEINNYNLADYIISRESINKDGIDWTVVKYASGDMHAWGNGKITFPSGNYTQWSAYWWRKVIYVNLPVTFYKLISAMAQGTINGRILETNDFPIMDNATRIEVHRYSTQNIATEETANAHFEIRGRWK